MKKSRLKGGLLLGAAASGALAVVSLGSAGTANATCASVSGIGNGNGCTSTPTSFALGVGTNATATANGLFNGAVAIGDNSTAAAGKGNFNFALAAGKQALATAQDGDFNIAVAIGNPAFNQSKGAIVPTSAQAEAFSTKSNGGLAVALGNGNVVQVGNGDFNRAVVVGTGSRAGIGGSGDNSTGIVFGNLSTAFAPGGNNLAAVFGNQSFAQVLGGTNKSAIAIGDNKNVTVP